jgi:hypothetical protein
MEQIVVFILGRMKILQNLKDFLKDMKHKFAITKKRLLDGYGNREIQLEKLQLC